MTTESKSRTLNPKRKQFCRNYVDNNGNATAAYRDAGYSHKGAGTSAHTLLENTDVQAEIARIRAIPVRTSASTRAHVLDNLHVLSLNGKPDSVKVTATVALGKFEGMDVREQQPGTASDVPQLRSYTLEELHRIRAVLVEDAKPEHVANSEANRRAIEAPAHDDDEPYAPAW